MASCAELQQVKVETVHPSYSEFAPRTIAVLPMDNMSVDLDATPLVRPIVNSRLAHKGYKVIALDKVDETLKEQGVLISHDVYGFTPGELGEITGADAVLYGTVTEFARRYAVIYASVVVGVKFELVDCRTSEVLWRSERYAGEDTTAETIYILLSEQDIEDALAEVAVYSAAFAALESYRPYAERVVKECLSSLPDGYLGASIYPWDLDPDISDDDMVMRWLEREHEIKTYAPDKSCPPAKEKERDSKKDSETKYDGTGAVEKHTLPPQNLKISDKQKTNRIVVPPSSITSEDEMEKLNRDLRKEIKKARKKAGKKSESEKKEAEKENRSNSPQGGNSLSPR